MSPSRWWVAVLGGLTLFLALGLTGASPTQAAYPAAAPTTPCTVCNLSVGMVTLTCNPDGSIAWTAAVANNSACAVPDGYTLALQTKTGSGPYRTVATQSGSASFAPGNTTVTGTLCYAFAPNISQMRVSFALAAAGQQCHPQGKSSGERPPCPACHTPTPTPTSTAVPPTLTSTAVPPTLTSTAVPPTLTPTAVPPTLTPTAVPPTLTPTAVPPTLTSTAVPPTLTPTAVPPTLTPTAVPPTDTPTATSTSTSTATSTPVATATCSPADTYNVLIVYADTGAPTSLPAALAAEPGIASVTLFNGSTGTPTLAQLQQYQIVVAFSNAGWIDQTTLGNNLASYETSGGIVVGFTFDWNGGSNAILGTWSTGGYSPFVNPGTVNFSNSSLGTYNAAHPLMQGVTTLNGFYRETVSLTAGATLVASWADGTPLIATLGRAVAVSAYVGDFPTNYSGQFARLVANAGRWLSPPPCAALTGKLREASTQTLSAEQADSRANIA